MSQCRSWLPNNRGGLCGLQRSRNLLADTGCRATFLVVLMGVHVHKHMNQEIRGVYICSVPRLPCPVEAYATKQLIQKSPRAVPTYLRTHFNRTISHFHLRADIHFNHSHTMAELSIFTVGVFQYVLITICFVMTIARMAYTYQAKKQWTSGDGWLIGVLCCFVGLWYSGYPLHGHGTNNVEHPELLSAVDIQEREKASKASLLARFCCTSAYVSRVDIRGCGS